MNSSKDDLNLVNRLRKARDPVSEEFEVPSLFMEAADEIERLTKQSRIWELKASGTLANNLCPDHRDKQVGKPCLACEIERLRTAIERIVGALGCVRDGMDGARGNLAAVIDAAAELLCGQRANETGPAQPPTPFTDQKSDAGLVNQELQDAMLNPATQVMFFG